MNLMLLPILIMGFFSVLEFIIPNQKTLLKQLYSVLFFLMFFIVAIKYYYGPDIHLYVPLYEKIEKPFYILKYGSAVANETEIGFVLYCSIFRWLGLSFWFFTASITFIYFYAVYKCFQQLKDYRLFALLLLVTFEANILFFEFRQTLSVAFFLLSILAFLNKKYFNYIVLTVLTVLFHKSGLAASLISLVVLVMPTIRYSSKYYFLVLLLLIFGIFLSFGDLIISLIQSLPISQSTISSIIHHFEVEKPFQVVLLVYVLVLYSIYYYANDADQKNRRYLLLMLVFFVIIALFYKYWFFLGRFRSYFVPLAIVFVINEMIKSKKNPVIYKQLLVLAVYMFIFTYGRGLYLSNRNSDTRILDATTIFSRINKSEKEIRDANMKKSYDYFESEYLKNQLKN